MIKQKIKSKDDPAFSEAIEAINKYVKLLDINNSIFNNLDRIGQYYLHYLKQQSCSLIDESDNENLILSIKNDKNEILKQFSFKFSDIKLDNVDYSDAFSTKEGRICLIQAINDNYIKDLSK